MCGIFVVYKEVNRQHVCWAMVGDTHWCFGPSKNTLGCTWDNKNNAQCVNPAGTS